MPRQTHSYKEYNDERLNNAITEFRCQRCGDRYPNTPAFLVIQDGARVCRPNCAYDYSPSETQIIADQSKIEADEIWSSMQEAIASQTGDAQSFSYMTNQPAVETISTVANGQYPNPVLLSPGGAGVLVTVTGVYFTSSDTISFSDSHITATAQSVATNQLSFTTTVTASSLCPRGDFDLFINSNRFLNAIKVR